MPQKSDILNTRIWIVCGVTILTSWFSTQPEVDCNRKCINNNQCGGYTAYNSTNYPNRCYFKNKSCKNNLFHLEQRTVTLLQGNKKRNPNRNGSPPQSFFQISSQLQWDLNENCEFIDINEYVKYEDKDCLRFSDIHHLRLDGAFDYGKCIEWCNNDDNCGGFTL